MGFELVGVRPCLRTGDECAALDKKAADAAFRRCKREVIDPFLASQGFRKYKTNAYVRRSGIDVLEYIDLQKEHYGSKTFTLNLAVMPLYTSAYEPRDVVAFYVSHRLGELICRRDLWWDFADERACAASMENVCAALERYGLPWFRRMSDERYVRLLLMKRKLTGRLSVYDEEWLAVLGERRERGALVRQRMEELGLPRALWEREE